MKTPQHHQLGYATFKDGTIKVARYYNESTDMGYAGYESNAVFYSADMVVYFYPIKNEKAFWAEQGK